MNSFYAPIHAARLVFGALAVVALLAAASAAAAAEPAAAAVAADEPADSDHFTPGWHSDVIRVANLGPAPGVAGRDRYAMAGMPHGDFVLVQRVGDKAKLIDAPVVNVHSSIENHYVFLEAGLGKVYALPLKDVPLLKAAGAQPAP